MGILTLLRNAFGRSRKDRAAETEGAERIPSQETVPAQEAKQEPAATAQVPEPRTAEGHNEHELVAAAFDNVTVPKPAESVETNPTPPAEPVPEPVAEAVTEAPSEPVAETEPELESEPVLEQEPTTEPVTEAPSEPVAEAEPVTEAPSEPVAETEPELKSEPVLEQEPTTEPVTEAPSEPVAEAEPVTEAPTEPVAETEPKLESEPVLEPEPTTQVEPTPEPVLEQEPVAEPAAEPTAAEATPEPTLEPTSEATPDPEPEPKAEEPKAEQPVAEQPVAEQPVAEEPKAQEPVAEEPSVEEPAAQEPTAEVTPKAEPAPEPVSEPEPELVAETPEPLAAEAEPVSEPEPVSAPELVTVDAAASTAEVTPKAEPEPATADAAAPAPAPAPEPVIEPVAADGEDTPQGPPAPDHESSTGGAGGNNPAEGEAEAGQPATPLTRLKTDAPALTSAYQAAAATLEKNNLTGTRAKLYLVLDRSASMRPYYKDGSAQALAEQTLALAATLDPEATVRVVFFSTEVDGTADLTLPDHENKIDELHASLGRMGRTSYHAAVEEIVTDYEKSGTTDPVLVVFQTDGAPDAKTPATQSLTDAAKNHPALFFSFVAFGDPENKAFDYLRKLKTDNASFFHAGQTPRELTDTELYEGVLATWRP
ncbi:VWA domain-containing protein [Streptomyces sp. NPDC002088]|uniref:VWA domain-containing protein n=1 Tax=Streptomyces sp. NPDC002088 TaxID=3154665 RepID=UPI003329F4B7